MEAVIFIGIQAVGKSTFYQERFAETHVRINLDTLKTRRREEALLHDCLRAGQSFVVDNTNVLASERARYILLAKPAGYRITGYYFPTSLRDALRRNQQRDGKAVIPERGIIAKFHAFQQPHYAEGFDQLFTVTIDEQNHFVVSAWSD
jgi:predicted kinase